MENKEYRLRNIKRSCLNCGHQYYDCDPCCEEPFRVSDLLRQHDALKEEIKDQQTKIDKLEQDLEYEKDAHNLHCKESQRKNDVIDRLEHENKRLVGVLETVAGLRLEKTPSGEVIFLYDDEDKAISAVNKAREVLTGTKGLKKNT